MTTADILRRKADVIQALGEEYADSTKARTFTERDFYLVVEMVLRALVDALEQEEVAA